VASGQWPAKTSRHSQLSILNPSFRPLVTDHWPLIFKERLMKWVRTTVRNAQTAGELFGFFGKQKRWWLLPIIISLFLLGALIVVAQSSSLAPFIYTMF
jgi:hypothetical protein